MNVKGLGWLGIRTSHFDDTTKLFGDLMGFESVRSEPDFAVFRLPNGDTIEVFGPSDTDHEHFVTGPVVGFQVEDVNAARDELQAAGVELIGDLQSGGGFRWIQFRGPDGTVYELTGRS